MAGEIEGRYDPYPEKDTVMKRFREMFHGDESGAAGARPPGAMPAPGEGDPMKRVPGEGYQPEPGWVDRNPLIERPVRGWVLSLPTYEKPTEFDVQALEYQQMLNQIGAEIDADGYFGTKSVDAINDFVAAYIDPQIQFSAGEVIPSDVLVALNDMARTMR